MAKGQHKYTEINLLPSDASLIPLMRPEHVEVMRLSGSIGDKARALGVPIGTVRSRLHRARSRLVRLRLIRELKNKVHAERVGGENTDAP